MKNLIITAMFVGIIIPLVAQTCIGVDTECGGSTNYCFNCADGDCGPFELSNGIYRIPYINGTDVTITNDHFNHCPRGRVDMVGSGGALPYKIAVAADGWIRAIEDDNNIQCDCSVTSCRNNYVWIEHPNGEWSKYTHMIQNSVTVLGHTVGDWVTAGTYLGIEGDVGCASGEHLHFEVAQPIDTNTLVFSEYGGYIDEDWARNVIPVICGISGNVFVDGVEYTADDCSTTCISSLLNLPETFTAGEYDADIAALSVTSGSVIFDDYSSGMYQAGDFISLLEGFEARQYSEFTARIGGCNEFPAKLSGDIAETQSPVEQDIHLRVAPNPASDFVTLQWSQLQNGPCVMELVDITGVKISQIMQSNIQQSGENQMQFSVHDLPSGIYFVKHQQGNMQSIIKLVVTKK